MAHDFLLGFLSGIESCVIILYKFVKNKLFLIIEQARLKYIDYFLKVGEKWKRKK